MDNTEYATGYEDGFASGIDEGFDGGYVAGVKAVHEYLESLVDDDVDVHEIVGRVHVYCMNCIQSEVDDD